MTPAQRATDAGEQHLSARPGGVWPVLTAGIREWWPPIERREFWAVQLLVLLIAGGHFAFEVLTGETEGALSYIPTSLFLVPVVYAALNFGLHGSLPTALWSAAVTIPNVAFFHHGGDRLGEIWQLGVVVTVAVFVGWRVDSEKRARRHAEDREQARRVSEEKYRGIFDNVVEPILVLDEDCYVEHANEAAAHMFATRVEEMTGKQVGELIDIDLGTSAAGDREARVLQPLGIGTGKPRWVQPVLIPLEISEAGQRRMQLMLRDLTAEHEREQELEAYAQRTMQAREEERGRIARELHDGPVQSLVILWRRLDEFGPLHDARQEDELRAAQRAVREAADELRRLSRNLRPSILDDLGLTSALRAEVAAFKERTGVVARLVSTGVERRLGPERELALLRITQEALRNVEQHASAKHASVTLRYEPGQVRLSITDDGRGILERAPTELVAANRLGLVGMREQARLIGATIAIGAGSRRGTRIELGLETPAR